jgi:Protein of unknown function (DUF3619)
MTNELDPGKIAQLLTQSVGHLDTATMSALVKARQNALKRQSVRTSVLSLSPASTNTPVLWSDRLIPHSVQPWIATGLLVAVLIAGTNYWQNIQEQQIDETDVAILTDDLPIEVFVD